MYRHGRFSCIDPRHWGHSEKIGRYPLLYPPPAPLGLGLHSAENLQSARHFHENGSDRDDVEGGRELGWFHGRRRPFLTWGLHGQIQHRGGLWCALFSGWDRSIRHAGGSYRHGGRPRRAGSAGSALWGRAPEDRQEGLRRGVPWADKPKLGKYERERAANMPRNGAYRLRSAPVRLLAGRGLKPATSPS